MGGEEFISWMKTTGKKKKVIPDNFHQVSPEELTLVYNLRKMMMNNWVSLDLYLRLPYLQQSYMLVCVKLQTNIVLFLQ